MVLPDLPPLNNPYNSRASNAKTWYTHFLQFFFDPLGRPEFL
jgi:hypothetical protein